MTIIQIIPNLNAGGAERLVSIISNSLVQNDHKVHIITFDKGLPHYSLDEKITVHFFIARFSLRKDNHFFQKLIDTIKPDIIHSHLHISDLMALSIQQNIPHIIHFHGPRKEFGGITRKINNSLKGKLINYLEKKWYIGRLKKKERIGFISISPEITNYIKDLNFPKKHLNKEIYNCFDENTFNPKPLNIPSEPFKLVSIGAINENKNQIKQLHIIKSIQDKGVEAELTIIGNGPLLKDLKNLAKNLNIDKNIYFTGVSKDPESLLKKSDLLLHTPIQEGFGLVIIEAFACGLPVVSSNAGGNNFLIQNNNNGFVAEESDEDFCQKIIEILKPNNYPRFRQNAIATSEEFKSDIYLKKLEDFYIAVINQQ